MFSGHPLVRQMWTSPVVGLTSVFAACGIMEREKKGENRSRKRSLGYFRTSSGRAKPFFRELAQTINFPLYNFLLFLHSCLHERWNFKSRSLHCMNDLRTDKQQRTGKRFSETLVLVRAQNTFLS
jgi:hypothetical protein